MRIFAALLLTAISAAQESTIRTSVSVVAIEVRVVGPNGPILGLQRADFRVTDQGESPEVLSCSRQDAKLDVLLLFDVSQSMGSAAPMLLTQQAAVIREFRSGDRVAAVAFDS